MCVSIYIYIYIGFAPGGNFLVALMFTTRSRDVVDLEGSGKTLYIKLGKNLVMDPG